MIELGAQPDRLLVHLTTGADFTMTLTYLDSAGVEVNWPTGTAISIDFGSSAWAATISGPDAVWDVDKATADAIGNGTPASLRYTNGDTDQTWATGKVIRHG